MNIDIIIKELVDYHKFLGNEMYKSIAKSCHNQDWAFTFGTAQGRLLYIISELEGFNEAMKEMQEEQDEHNDECS